MRIDVMWQVAVAAGYGVVVPTEDESQEKHQEALRQVIRIDQAWASRQSWREGAQYKCGGWLDRFSGKKCAHPLCPACNARDAYALKGLVERPSLQEVIVLHTRTPWPAHGPGELQRKLIARRRAHAIELRRYSMHPIVRVGGLLAPDKTRCFWSWQEFTLLDGPVVSGIAMSDHRSVADENKLSEAGRAVTATRQWLDVLASSLGTRAVATRSEFDWNMYGMTSHIQRLKSYKKLFTTKA